METWVLAVVVAVGLIAISVASSRRAPAARLPGPPAEPSAPARQVHYVFAHRVLPGMAHARPELLDLLRGPEGDDFLDHVWRDLHLKAGAPPPAASPGRSRERAGEHEVLLVTMPPPEVCPEAAFVALVPLPAGLRVFALELSVSLRGEPVPWVLGEWTKDGSHLNLGPRGPCTPEAFLAAIREVVAA
jgi:hypothetical protein